MKHPLTQLQLLILRHTATYLRVRLVLLIIYKYYTLIKDAKYINYFHKAIKMVTLEKPLIIEIAGHMCSGKSTCASYLKKKLTKENIKIKEYQLKHIPITKLINIKATYATLYIFIKTRPLINISNIRRLLIIYHTLIQYEYINSKKNAVFVKDQGLFQTISSLRRFSKKKPKPIWTSWLISNIYLPNILVIITADLEVNNSRRKNRDNKTFSDKFFIENNKRLDLTIKEAIHLEEKEKKFKHNIIINNDINDTYKQLDNVLINNMKK
ncbi:MAG: hypothetical protein WD037_13600 [Balneolales bacterium]